MAKAKRLPSGNYNVSVYDYTDENGKRRYKSFTAPTLKEVNFLAAQYQLNKKKEKQENTIRVGEGIDEYLKARSDVLSPSTYKNYLSMRKLYFGEIEKIKLSDLDVKMLQPWINKLSLRLSQKTIKNIWGLLTASYSVYYPDRRLSVDLPQKVKAKIIIPKESEVKALLAASEGTPVEIAILFACCLGMRRSEIVAVDWKNVDLQNKTLDVHEVVVIGIGNKEFRKYPKSYAGSRTLVLPELLVRRLEQVPEKERTGPVVSLNGNVIYKRFSRLLEQCKIRHYRFHDLRHYFASVMHSLGIPSKYAAMRMGHADETMIMRVYQHIMDTTENESTKKLNEYFQDFQEIGK